MNQRQRLLDQEFTQDELRTERWEFFPLNQKYSVSTLGRIKSHLVRPEGKLLNPTLSKQGRFYINTVKDGVVTTYAPHQMVAITYLPPAEDGKRLFHKDSKQENNRVSNLVWLTSEEAMNSNLLESRPGRKPIPQRIYCTHNGKTYESASECAKDIGISTYKVNRVIHHEDAANPFGLVPLKENQ